MLDETESLDEILVNDGSHLVINSNTKASNILGDGRSMVHLAPGSVTTLGNDMTTHCLVYEGAVLNLTTSSIVIAEYLYVNGRIDSTPNAAVLLAKPATVYLAAQDLTISELTIEAEALLSVTSSIDAVFNLSLTKLEVHGELLAGPTDFFDITDFIVGTSGNVELDPVDEDEHLGQNIEIRGTVTLGHAVSFKRPCEDFVIDLGKLSWDITTSKITLECRRVIINGPFSPGVVTFGEGIEEFTVGNNGTLTVTAHGPVFMNGISVAGTLNVQNVAEILSKNGTHGMINYFIIHPPNGKVYLNNANKPRYDSNGDVNNVTCNTIRVENLIINGIFSAKTLDIGDGIDSLYVDDHGNFIFTPCNEYRIHEIYVNGSVTCTTPITLKGTNLEKVHDFIIDPHGVVKFDNDVLSTKSWSGSSQIGIHNIEVSGTFHAGKMINRIAENGGWDRLSVLKGGAFYFEPDDDFIIDYATLNGVFQAYKAINVLTKRPEQDLIVHIGSTGNVKFDSLITTGWTNLSNITAQTLETWTSSYFSAGNTKFDLKSMKIGGTLLAYPSEDISASYFEVTNTGSVDVSRTVNIDGQTMIVRGTLDVSYKHQPENVSSGSLETEITYDDVTVSGTFKAGSIYLESKTLLVTGTIDVSGGGYMADKGPGKKYF